MKYYIYKMMHPKSGVVYIGQHKIKKGCTDLVNDGYHGSGRRWRELYRRHPEECIKVIIDYAANEEEANALEKKYIKHYKEVYGEYCYNINVAGAGVSLEGLTE